MQVAYTFLEESEKDRKNKLVEWSQNVIRVVSNWIFLQISMEFLEPHIAFALFPNMFVLIVIVMQTSPTLTSIH